MTNPRRRWWALAALTPAILVFDLNLTIVHIALPTLAVELNATLAQLQWLPNAYMLMVAAALLPAGLLGDRFGPKRPLLVALVASAVATVVCAYAPTPGALILGQGLLGLSSGFVPALSLALINRIFSAEERPRALAVWSAGLTLGVPLGPIVGGALLAHFWWGAVYLINLPLSGIALVMGALLLPATSASPKVRVDLPGLLTATVGAVLLTYGLVAAGEQGPTAPVTWGTSVMGIVLLAVFVLWIRRAPAPIVRPALFHDRRFTGGVLLSTVVTFALMGAIFVLPQYFQAVFDVGPLGTGLRLMPVVGGLLAGVLAAGPIRRTHGSWAVIAVGFVVLAGAAVLGALTSGAGYGTVAAWTTIVGIGAGLALPATMNAAMSALGPDDSGVGSAMIQVFRQIGGVLGVSLLGGILAGGYRSGVDVSGLSTGLAEEALRTAAGGVRVAEESGSAALMLSVREALAEGMSGVLWTTAGVALVGAVVALLLVSRAPDGDPAPVAP